MRYIKLTIIILNIENVISHEWVPNTFIFLNVYKDSQSIIGNVISHEWVENILIFLNG